MPNVKEFKQFTGIIGAVGDELEKKINLKTRKELRNFFKVDHIQFVNNMVYEYESEEKIETSFHKDARTDETGVYTNKYLKIKINTFDLKKSNKEVAQEVVERLLN